VNRVSIRRAALALPAIAWLLISPDAARSQESAARTPSPAGARVYFISPGNAATVTSPVLIQFGLSGMGVAPASLKFPNTGHHHLIVDAPLPPLDQPIPADKQHVHYGAGLTETKLELAPGQHTLQLLLGDEKHVPHDPPVYSEPITISVK
jgi:hypothetical protein